MADYSMTYDISDDTGELTAVLRERNEDGKFDTIDTQVFDPEGVHETLKAWVLGYGLSKVLQDRNSAIPSGPDKLAAMQETFADLAGGKKNKDRTRTAPTVSIEVEALANLKGVPIAVIQKSLGKYTKEQKEAIFAKPSVQAEIAKVKANREAASETELDLESL